MDYALLQEYAMQPRAQEETVSYLAEKLSHFVKWMDPVLICLPDQEPGGLSHLMEQAVACYREHGVEPPADLEKRLVVVGAFLDGLVFYTGMDPEFEPKTVLPILTDILLYLEKNDGKPSAKGKAEKEA